MTDTPNYPIDDADRVATLDDDLRHTLEPYAWLGELQTGNIRSWSQDMWRDMVFLAERLQQARGKLRGSGDDR